MALMLDVLLRISLVLATGFLTGIVLLAYLRVKSKRLLLITSGFAVFFVHALMYMPELMLQDITFKFTDNLHIGFNLLALLLITIGIMGDEE